MKAASKEGSGLLKALSGLPKLARGDKIKSGGLLSLLSKGKENSASEPSTEPSVRCACCGHACYLCCACCSTHAVLCMLC